MTKKPTLIFLFLLVGTFSFPQALSAQVLQGEQRYTPSRLDWLATTLNAYYRIPMSREKRFSLTYVGIENQNAILLFVRYWPDVNREEMNADIENAKELINISAKSYGWNSWLKVKEDVKMNRLEKD